jgi:hypothetical protein
MIPQPTIKCVKLKDDIQAKLLQATKDLSPEEMVSRRRKKLEDASTPLMQWWHRLTSHQPVA